MRPTINIDNYEEIMFQLLEGDFDEQTCNDLLQQIEKDELFKFEWEAWQKTRFVDPIENYLVESRELETTIIQIAEPEKRHRKLIFYFSAAATFLLLISTLFLLTADFNSKSGKDFAKTDVQLYTLDKNAIASVKPTVEPIMKQESKLPTKQRKVIETVSVSEIIKPVESIENTIAEIRIHKDSVPIKTVVLAKTEEKKTHYKVTIETTQLADISQLNNELAQNRKGKIGQILTNPKLLFQRKLNGEPDRIILLGDVNSYLCINLNYTEK